MHKIKSSLGSRGDPNCLVVWYINDQNKIRTFMLEFHVRSIPPLHSKDFQLLCSSYIGLHKLRTPYAFPLSINLSLMKYCQKIIILDAETWYLPTRKLQQVNAYWIRNNFKKYIRLHFNCEIYFQVYVFLHLQTVEMPSCGISSGYALIVKVEKDLRAKNTIFSSRRKR